jgi:hypothetical protein
MRLFALHDETFSLGVSPRVPENSIPTGTLANHSVGAARPRSLIIGTQKSASSSHEGKNPESEPQTLKLGCLSNCRSISALTMLRRSLDGLRASHFIAGQGFLRVLDQVWAEF